VRINTRMYLIFSISLLCFMQNIFASTTVQPNNNNKKNVTAKTTTKSQIKTQPVKTLKAKPKGPKPNAPKRTPLTFAMGKKIYENHCSVCHDSGFKQAPIIGKKKVWEKIIKPGMEVTLLRTIHGYKDMPKRGACQQCTTKQLIAAVKYILKTSKVKGDHKLW
jgi:cytochrome c5